MKIEQTYDETLIRFMIEQKVFLPMVADMDHSEFCSCIGVSRDGLEWSFVNRRNIARIEDDFFSCHNQGIALWDAAYRTKTRPGRVIRKLYLCAGLPEPRPEFVADIVRRWDLFTGYKNNDYTLKVLQGEEVRWAYNFNNNVSNEGSLANSCMNKVSCQPYLDLYTRNPQVRLAVVAQGEKIAARCLVWNSTYYDRVYSSDNYTGDLLREYCLEQGWASCYDNRDRIRVALSHVDFRQYPYLDSMIYIDMGDGAACNYEPHDCWYRICGSTTGNYDEHNAEDDSGFCCHSCDDEVSERDAICIDGDYYCSDCVRYSERYGEYIEASEAVYCECEDGYILADDAVSLGNGEFAHQDDVIELYDGEYAHKDDEDIIELHDGQYARSDDSDIVCIDGGHDTYAHIDACIEDRDGDYMLTEASIELYDGERAHEATAMLLHDGRYAHEDDIVRTYNGLIALFEECAVLTDGHYALLYDPIVQFDKMSKADRGSLAAWAA